MTKKEAIGKAYLDAKKYNARMIVRNRSVPFKEAEYEVVRGDVALDDHVAACAWPDGEIDVCPD